MCKEELRAGEISLGRCALLLAIFGGFWGLFLWPFGARELRLPGRGERTRGSLSAAWGELGLLLIIIIVAVVVVVIPGGFPGVPRSRP